MAGAEQPPHRGALVDFKCISTDRNTVPVKSGLSLSFCSPGGCGLPQAAKPALPRRCVLGSNARGSNTRAENAARGGVCGIGGIGVCADRGILANPI